MPADGGPRESQNASRLPLTPRSLGTYSAQLVLNVQEKVPLDRKSGVLKHNFDKSMKAFTFYDHHEAHCVLGHSSGRCNDPYTVCKTFRWTGCGQFSELS